MKKIVSVVVMLMLCLIAGCNSAAEQGYYEKMTDVLNESVDAQQVATKEIVLAISESNLVDAEKLEKLEGVVSKVDEYVDTAQSAVAEAARVWEEKRAENQIVATIEAVRAANAASSTVNPYAPIIDGVLGLAVVIAGGYGIKKSKDLSTTAKKYEAHKRGTEAVMRASTDENAEKLYNAIGGERKKLGI